MHSIPQSLVKPAWLLASEQPCKRSSTCRRGRLRQGSAGAPQLGEGDQQAARLRGGGEGCGRTSLEWGPQGVPRGAVRNNRDRQTNQQRRAGWENHRPVAPGQ